MIFLIFSIRSGGEIRSSTYSCHSEHQFSPPIEKCDCYGSCSCRMAFKLCENIHPMGTTFPERFSTIGCVLLCLALKTHLISAPGVQNWRVWWRKIKNRSIFSSSPLLWVTVSPSSDGVTQQTWSFLILETSYLNVLHNDQFPKTGWNVQKHSVAKNGQNVHKPVTNSLHPLFSGYVL